MHGRERELWTTSKQPVREAVSYRGLFTAGWFGVKEKYCSRLKIYDRLRASEQAEGRGGSRAHKSHVRKLKGVFS